MSDALISRAEVVKTIRELYEWGTPTEEELVASVRQLRGKAKQSHHLDHGRIMALYRAGWRVVDIADDLRCTTAAVYTHIKDEKARLGIA